MNGSAFENKRDAYLLDLGKEIAQCRGSELPRFHNYEVFRTRINNIIRDYLTPMTEALERAIEIISKAYNKLVNDYFKTFPLLQSAVRVSC